jgi:branched-chain amino acid transport system permease protein
VTRSAAIVLGLAALVAWPFVVNAPFVIHIAIMIALYSVLALSMNLMLRIGQLSLAHGAFMGLGAYTSALLSMRLKAPFPLAFLAAGIAVAIVATVIGPIFLRIRGVYFVLLTFAFGEVVQLMFVEWVDVFGGNNGLYGIPKPSLFGFTVSTKPAFYVLALALAVLVLVAVRALFRSQVGAVIGSLDDNELLSRSIGVDAPRYRLAVFAFSAFLAGLAGSFYAHYLTFISPEAFGFWTPVNMVVVNVLGGIVSPWGPVLGSLLLVPLPEILRDVRQYQVLAYGLLLMGFLLFLPNGLVDLGARFAFVRKGKGRAA